jgi:hypothetical protein
VSTGTLTWSGYQPSSSTLSTGVSEVAQQLRGQLTRIVTEGMRTASGQSLFVHPRMALQESYREAAEQAQYGEQSLPSAAALHEAHEFLEALPPWAPTPVPLIEPSGAIAFEWDLGPERWLVFALKGTGTIEHSAKIGLGNEEWGTRNFSGDLGRREKGLLAELVQAKA